jgi:ligand-binding sensor domain-containing protein
LPRFDKVNPPNGRSFLHITGIAQDKRGYLWLASKRGLFRYNGYEMINYKFDPVDPNSIPSDALETICVDTAGNIWIGSLGAGLFRFDPIRQKFTRFRSSKPDTGSIGSDWISALYSDSKGNVWVGTGNGLDRYDAATNKFVHYESKADDTRSLSANEVVGIYEDKQGTLWIGTGSVYGENRTLTDYGGLNRMDDISGKFTRFKHDPNDPNTIISNKVRAMFEGSDGTFWVGTAGNGLHTMDRKTGKFQRRTGDVRRIGELSRPPLSNDPFAMISFITEDAAGGIWIGTTDNGLSYHDRRSNRTLHVFPAAEAEMPFGNENPWAAFNSADGLLWIGTIAGTLYKYNPVQVRIPFFQTEARDITGFHESADGTFWLTSSEDGLLHLDQSKNLIRRYNHEPGDPNSLRSNKLIALTPGSKGDFWIGTLGAGIEHFNPATGKFTHYFRDRNNTATLSNDTVIRIYEDAKGDIWAGTFRGLSVMNRKTGAFKRYVFYPGDTASFGKNLVSSIMHDKAANCWVGSFVGGGVHALNVQNSSTKTYLQGISITNLLEDSKGKLWAGGIEGLFYYEASLDSFMRFNDPLDLTQVIDVSTMIEDDSGNLWIGTSNSIKLISAQRDVVTTLDHHFGVGDLTIGNTFKGRKGALFFPASGGFYELNPTSFNKESRPPKILLSNFRLLNQLVLPGDTSVLSQDISITDHIRLRYNQNIFSFDFAAIDFVDPDANKHLFMLENYDRSWNIPGFDRRAIYFNVPPGKYVFRVRAVNAYGKWSEKAVEIEIVPAWWSQWWFRIAAIVAAIAIIYFLIRWRLNVKYRLQMERSEKEKELSRLQHRTAQLEMHALRAQMNPHFLFNSLNSINRFIIQNNSEQASGYLTKFSRLMRLILQNSQYELIPLENELEALKLYLELEAVRFDHHFTYTIKIDDRLDVSALKVPPLIIQPYAENAIWHGLMHKEEKGKLLIELEEQDDYLVCRITDDGIGRKKAAELKSKSASTHKSMGMKITADRIASMRRRKSGDNNIQITDLVLPDGSPAGTRVEIKLALQYD